MATRPLDAAHHHRMIDHHARKLRELAGKGGSTVSRSKTAAAARKARSDVKGTWPTKK